MPAWAEAKAAFRAMMSASPQESHERWQLYRMATPRSPSAEQSAVAQKPAKFGGHESVGDALGNSVLGAGVVGIRVGDEVGLHVSPRLVGLIVVGWEVVGARVVGARVGAGNGAGVGIPLGVLVGCGTSQQAAAQRMLNSMSRTCTLVNELYVQQAPSAAKLAQFESESRLSEHDGAWVGDVDGAEVGAPVVGDTVVGSAVVGARVGSVVG